MRNLLITILGVFVLAMAIGCSGPSEGPQKIQKGDYERVPGGAAAEKKEGAAEGQ